MGHTKKDNIKYGIFGRIAANKAKYIEFVEKRTPGVEFLASR